MAPYEDNRLRVEHEAPIKNWPQAYWRLMKQINPDEAIVFETELKEMKLEYVLSSYYGPSAKDLKNIIS